MSTPKAHNAIFAASVIEAVSSYNTSWELSPRKVKGMIKKIIQASIAGYNYPDAFQAARDKDGKMIGRAVSHFECGKYGAVVSNSHVPFTPEQLKKITDKDVVEFHSTGDQVGDFMGQLTDSVAIEKAFSDFVAEGASYEKMRLAAMVKMHLYGADRYNDLLFREMLDQDEDGKVYWRIDEFPGKDSEKTELTKAEFIEIKNLIMTVQEEIACQYLGKAIASVDGLDWEEINGAIHDSYFETYSPWLAPNTWKYVKELKPSYELVLPSEAYTKLGMSREQFIRKIDEFVRKSIAFTRESIATRFYANSVERTMMFFS